MDGYLTKYVNRISKTFANQNNLNEFINQIKFSYSWTISNMLCFPVSIENEQAIIMKKSHSDKEGYFGFLNIDNSKENSLLWRKVVETASKNNIKKLRGPIQGSTYFPYRFISYSNGMNFFKGEFFSMSADNDYILSCKPDNIINYKSAIREDFNEILKITKPVYNKLVEKGLRIEVLNKPDLDFYKEIYKITNVTFSENWGYENLSFDEFLKFANSNQSNQSKLSMHKVMFGDKLVGFSRYLEESDDVITFKTAAILPKYQKMGIGIAIAYKGHEDAIELGYKKAIYALVRFNNRVDRMPQPDLINFREYSSYEFNL